MPLLACPAVQGKTPEKTLLDKLAVAPELSETDFFNGLLTGKELPLVEGRVSLPLGSLGFVFFRAEPQ